MSAQPIELPDCARETLDLLYPSVDWDRVTFYRGLPWYTTLFAPGTGALTMPDPLSVGRFNVFLGENTDFCDTNDLSTLVHEAFHIYQFMGSSNGYGIGSLRPGFVTYVRRFLIHGYDDSPSEIEAYEYDAAFVKCLPFGPQGKKLLPCSCPGPETDPEVLDALDDCNNGSLINAETYSAPPTTTKQWVATLLATIVVWIMWLIQLILGVFSPWVCETIRRWQAQCKAYAKKTSESCEQWKDERTKTCVEKSDKGQSKCSETAQQQYSECCTWIPCKWACRALVWFTRTICVAWTWIAKWVCVAWAWITNVVCQVWVVVVRVVCTIILWILQIITLCRFR